MLHPGVIRLIKNEPFIRNSTVELGCYGLSNSLQQQLGGHSGGGHSGGVGAVVRSLPSNPKVPGSIPGSDKTGIFGDLLSR